MKQLLTISAAVLLASFLSAAKVNLSVYPYPATLGIESELIIPDGFSGNGDAELVITSPDGKVKKYAVKPVSGKPFFKWKPEMTGYHKLELKGKNISAVRNVPAVWRRMYFFGWTVPTKAPELAKYPVLGSCGVVIKGNPAVYAEYRKYGIRPLAYVSFRAAEIRLSDPIEKNVDKLVRKWQGILRSGADGIWIDEMGCYPDEKGLELIRVFGRALQQLNKLHPDKLVILCNAGTTQREQAAMCRNANVILCPEIYPDCVNGVFGAVSFEKYLDSRIQILRENDMLFERGYGKKSNPASYRRGCGVILLGLNNCFSVVEEPFNSKLEHYVRYIKKNAPEMGGLAFWSSGGDRRYLEKHIPYRLQNDLLERYYISPVLDVRGNYCSDYAPVKGEKLTVSCEVANIGGMKLYRPYTLRAYAVDPTGKRELIGEAARKVIGVGMGDVPVGISTENVITWENEGNKYIATNRKGALKAVNLGRHTISFDFTPQMKGIYRLVFELDAPEGIAVINGSSSRELYVR